MLQLDHTYAFLSEMTLVRFADSSEEHLTHLSTSLFDGTQLLHFNGQVAEIQAHIDHEEASEASLAATRRDIRRALTRYPIVPHIAFVLCLI